MKIVNKFPSLATGLALFAMFFGAGNVTFPLLLGHHAGSGIWWAMAGLLVTAVGMPLFGLVTMLKFDGDYRVFFERAGKVPGAFFILLSMALMGPLVGIPRSIDVAYASMSYVMLDTPLWLFSFCAMTLTFACCLKKSETVDIIGVILTPILLLLLIYIIIVALFNPIAIPQSTTSIASNVLYGAEQGYNTMDLLAALFFSTIVVQNIKSHAHQQSVYTTALKAGLIGGSLLAIIYLGSAYVAAMYTPTLAPDVHLAQLLTAIADKVLGKIGGELAAIVVSLACLTTAISLVVITTDFIHDKIYQQKIPYLPCLIFICLASFVVSLMGFEMLIDFIAPILMVCYPMFIVITACNLLYKKYGSTVMQTPLLLTAVTSIYLSFF